MSHWLLLEGEIVEVDVYCDLGCTKYHAKPLAEGMIGYIRRPTKTEEVVYSKRFSVWHGLRDNIDNFAGLIKAHNRKQRRKRVLQESTAH